MINRLKYAGGLPLALIASLTAPPIINSKIGNATDANIQWFFNSITVNAGWDTIPTIFPHGPLAFIQYPMAMAWIPVFMLVLNLVVKWSIIASVIGLSKRLEFSKWKEAIGLIVATGIGILVPFYLQFLALCTLLAFILLLSSSLTLSGLFSLCIGVATFIKADLAIYCLLVFAVVMVRNAILKRWNIILLSLVVWSVVGAIVYTFQFGGKTMLNSFEYLYGLYHLVIGNGAAMTIVDDPVVWQVLSGLVVFSYLVIRLKDKHGVWQFTILALPLLAAWKHGVVRLDHYHAAGIMDALVIFWILCLVWIQSRKQVVIYTIGALLSLTLMYISFDESVYGFEHFSWIKATPQNYASYFETMMVEPMPDYTLSSVDLGATADVIPIGFHYLWQSDLKPHMKPVIQAYAANTPWLDQKVANHFEENPPEYLIWHTNASGHFTSIDARSSWSDIPLTLDLLNQTFHLHSVEKSALVLKKSASPKPTNSRVKAAEYKMHMFDWKELEPVPDVWASANIEVDYSSFWNRIKALIYRKLPILFQLKTASGDVHTYRMPNVEQNRSILISNDYCIVSDSILLVQDIVSWRVLADTQMYSTEMSVTTYKSYAPAWLSDAKELVTDQLVNIQGQESIKPRGFTSVLNLEIDSNVLENNWCKVVAYASIISNEIPDGQLVLKAIHNGESIEQRIYINTAEIGTKGMFFGKAELLLSNSELVDLEEIKCSVWNASKNHSFEVDQMYLAIQSE